MVEVDIGRKAVLIAFTRLALNMKPLMVPTDTRKVRNATRNKPATVQLSEIYTAAGAPSTF